MKIQIKEMTPGLWEDLEQLFGEKGACGGCWCMWWRMEPGEKWQDVKGPPAKKRLCAMIESGAVRGLIAYNQGEPSGGALLAKEQIFLG